MQDRKADLTNRPSLHKTEMRERSPSPVSTETLMMGEEDGKPIVSDLLGLIGLIEHIGHIVLVDRMR